MTPKPIGPAGFIIGGILVLASAYGPDTTLPWYVKVTGGVGLIVYGLVRLLQSRNKAAE